MSDDLSDAHQRIALKLHRLSRQSLRYRMRVLADHNRRQADARQKLQAECGRIGHQPAGWVSNGIGSSFNHCAICDALIDEDHGDDWHGLTTSGFDDHEFDSVDDNPVEE